MYARCSSSSGSSMRDKIANFHSVRWRGLHHLDRVSCAETLAPLAADRLCCAATLASLCLDCGRPGISEAVAHEPGPSCPCHSSRQRHECWVKMQRWRCQPLTQGTSALWRWHLPFLCRNQTIEGTDFGMQSGAHRSDILSKPAHSTSLPFLNQIRRRRGPTRRRNHERHVLSTSHAGLAEMQGPAGKRCAQHPSAFASGLAPVSPGGDLNFEMPCLGRLARPLRQIECRRPISSWSVAVLIDPIRYPLHKIIIALGGIRVDWRISPSTL